MQGFGGHHAIAKDRAAQRRGQCPKPRARSRAGGAQRRGIDGAEHSSRVDWVMAALVWRERQNYARRQRAQSDPSRAKRPGRERPSGPRCGPRGKSWRGVAHVPTVSQQPQTRAAQIAARAPPTSGPYDAQVQSHVWVAADRGNSADVSLAPGTRQRQERLREDHALSVPLPLHPSAVPHSQSRRVLFRRW